MTLEHRSDLLPSTLVMKILPMMPYLPVTSCRRFKLGLTDVFIAQSELEFAQLSPLCHISAVYNQLFSSDYICDALLSLFFSSLSGFLLQFEIQAQHVVDHTRHRLFPGYRLYKKISVLCICRVLAIYKATMRLSLNKKLNSNDLLLLRQDPPSGYFSHLWS